MPWFRGNLHTHTTNSDGDSPPDEVVAWYRDAGYDFLALTDHDLLTLPSDHAAAAGSMLLVHGEEVTAGDVHVNGARHPLHHPAGHRGHRRRDPAAQRGRRPGRWRHGLRQPPQLPLAGRSGRSRRAPGLPSPRGLQRRAGDQQRRPPGPAIARRALGRGPLAPIDASTPSPSTTPTIFKVFGRPYSNPGRGWVHIRAARLSEATVLEALSDGALLRLLRRGAGRRLVEDDASWPSTSCSSTTLPIARPSSAGVARSSTSSMGSSPATPLSGREGYVRARVDDSDGLSPGSSRSSWTRSGARPPPAGTAPRVSPDRPSGPGPM